MKNQSTTETATATDSPHGPREADGTLLELLAYLAQRRDRAARGAERHEYRLAHADDDKARRTCARWARLAREREQWYARVHKLVAGHVGDPSGGEDDRHRLVGKIMCQLQAFPGSALQVLADGLNGKPDEAPRLRLANGTTRKAVRA